MNNTIAKTDYYSIAVDRVKNRAYLTLAGFCDNAQKMSDFLSDVKTAARELKTGFTLLTDASQMKIPPAEVSELHKKSQMIWIEKGLHKTAEIMPKSTILKMTLKRYSDATGMEKKEFLSRTQAEAWLDTKAD